MVTTVHMGIKAGSMEPFEKIPIEIALCAEESVECLVFNTVNIYDIYFLY